MTRITHFKQQPINVQYWDYYILCHLNTDATLALQRMEYWDGTKDDSNTHAEAINDAMAKSGTIPNQDTSYWVYKSLDELQWELMGASGEKRLPKLVDFLIKELEYLDRRNNPFEGWDRKKQYKFNAEVVQEHINYLGYIISYFNLPLRNLRPVFCAIEALTKEKVYIDTLNVDMVLGQIEQFKECPKTPHFLKSDLEKFDKVFMRPHVRSFRTFAEWKAQKCGMHSAESPNASRNNAECIPQNRGSNSIEFNIDDKDIEDNHNKDTFGASIDSAALTPQEKIAKLEALIEELKKALPHQGSDSTVLEGGNTQAQQLHDLFEQWNQEPAVDDYPTEFERTQMRETDHNAIPEPLISATDGLTQESAVTTHSENETPEIAPQSQEMPSSVQAVNGTTNQAKEQGTQQANGANPIASGATKKARGGRGKKVEQEPAKLVVVEPDLSHLSEQEQQIYAGLRDEDKPKFLDFTPALREVYINWLGSYGFAVPVDITPKFVECLKRLVPLHPSFEILRKKREGIKKLDNQRPPEKRYFKNRNPLIWDVVRDWATVDVTENVAQPGTPTSEAPKTYMTRDEAAQLAHDAIAEAKQYTIVVTAQVASLENNPDAWIVRVRWDDGSKDGMIFSIRTRGQWGKKLKEIQKMSEEDAKRAARVTVRMQEAK